MNARAMNRRDFLRRSAGAAATAAVAAGAMNRVVGANERISLGLIGTGGRGQSYLGELKRIVEHLPVEVTAVCDLWTLNRDAAAAKAEEIFGHRPRAFQYHEDLLELNDVDAVTIATPDHWHIPILLDALEAGKDAYVEKPLSYTLEEAKQARDAVRRTGRIVQVGTQRRSEGALVAAVEFVRSGRLGKVSMAECCWNDNSPRWRRGDLDRLKEEDVDWKRYLNGREMRPFNPHHYLEWKLYKDFTIGVAGLLGSHMIDVVHWLMDTPYPRSAMTGGGVYIYKDDRTTDDTFTTVFEYPQEFILIYTTRLGNSYTPGTVLYGKNGTFFVDKLTATGSGGAGPDKIEEDIKIERKPSTNHLRNFLECVRSREEPNAPIEVGLSHMVACIMAEESLTRRKRIVWDEEKEEIRET
jgi:predicted dehydrogenase